MKDFKVPMMTIIHLTNENIICDSNCPPHFCPDFICDDCVECPGPYHCYDFLCNEKYSG